MIDTKLKTMVVEDSKTNLLIAKAFLEDIGCEVIEAVNGKHAVEKFTDDIAVIFMDINMPEMDGYAATENIRSLSGGADVPIIGLSAAITCKEVLQKCLVSGMNDCMSKPISIDVVKTKLDKWLGKNSSEWNSLQKQLDGA